MSGRFINPLPQFSDSTPTMYAGAKLFFYATGTSTKLSTYTTKALSVANTNPIVLDSAGRIPSDIFLQDLEYKVVLAPSTDTDPPTSPIWTADPVSHRDSALVAKTLTGSGTPNGSVAGTAGSSSILPDFYWDYTNSILYVCTTTGTSSTAVWTAVNASAATTATPFPQGRLTLTSAAPVLAAGVTAGTTVYYTPYVGNLIPIYSGSTMVPTVFTEMALVLNAAHSISTIYDVFIWSNSGVLGIATGPAWTTSTAGAGARGTGASTTELTRVNGLWVNAVSMTARNGATTYTIGANLGTYVGSIFIDGSAGQITCHTAWGQSRKWGVWNAYNRAPTFLKAGDATASWTVNNASAIHAANTSSANSITVFAGLPEEIVKFEHSHRASATLNSTNEMVVQVGIGFNSTTTISGRVANHTLTSDTLSNFLTTNVSLNGARHFSTPWIGINVVTALEHTNGSDVNVTMYGGEDDMLLSAEYRS
jgi:hypothetical protein